MQHRDLLSGEVDAHDEPKSVRRVCAECGFAGRYRSDASADYHHGRHSCYRHRSRATTTGGRRTRPRRECRHPRTQHHHGTRAAYVKDRCRCRPCTRANTLAKRVASRARAYGMWTPYVDADPARAHVNDLLETGLSLRHVAKLAGLSPATVRALVAPGPSPRVRHATAEAILSVVGAPPRSR